jgi:hypothetical protein
MIAPSRSENEKASLYNFTQKEKLTSLYIFTKNTLTMKNDLVTYAIVILIIVTTGFTSCEKNGRTETGFELRPPSDTTYWESLDTKFKTDTISILEVNVPLLLPLNSVRSTLVEKRNQLSSGSDSNTNIFAWNNREWVEVPNMTNIRSDAFGYIAFLPLSSSKLSVNLFFDVEWPMPMPTPENPVIAIKDFYVMALCGHTWTEKIYPDIAQTGMGFATSQAEAQRALNTIFQDMRSQVTTKSQAYMARVVCVPNLDCRNTALQNLSRVEDRNDDNVKKSNRRDQWIYTWDYEVYGNLTVECKRR